MRVNKEYWKREKRVLVGRLCLEISERMLKMKLGKSKVCYKRRRIR
jgi:hypothetical protein